MPLSDRRGRRRPLVAVILVFTFAWVLGEAIGKAHCAELAPRRLNLDIPATPFVRTFNVYTPKPAKKPGFLIPFGAYVLPQALDLWTTHRGEKAGLREGNPPMRLKWLRYGANAAVAVWQIAADRKKQARLAKLAQLEAYHTAFGNVKDAEEVRQAIRKQKRALYKQRVISAGMRGVVPVVSNEVQKKLAQGAK